MGHNTTLFFAHGHSIQICCRGYTQDTNEAFQKWYAYERNRGTWARFSLAQRQQRHKHHEITTTDSAE